MGRAKYTIGIDLGGTNTRVGLVSKDAKVVETLRFATRDYKTENTFIEKLCADILSLLGKYDFKPERLGVGIGAPNANFYSGAIENAPNLLFSKFFPLRDLLKERLKVEGVEANVQITNDANAAAMGEKIYGNAKQVNDFLMITLGTGVGSGVFVDGKLVYGESGFAGEAGHTIIEPHGRACTCGRDGCLESYCAARGIVATAKELLENGTRKSLLRELKEEEITPKTIDEAAIKGDELALECFDKTAEYLALGLANAAIITSPEKIFIAGGLSKAGDKLFVPLKKYFETALYPVFRGRISIEPSALQESEAAILGAAALAAEE